MVSVPPHPAMTLPTLTERTVKKMTDAKTKEIANLTRDEDALASITTLDDAFTLLAGAGVSVTEAKDLGSGFVVLDKNEKNQLVGKGFIVIGAGFHNGDMGEFVSLHVVTEDGGKFIINDGGTGIKDQAKRYAEKGKLVGLLCRKGLTRSDYETEINGKMTPATTYYLSSV